MFFNLRVSLCQSLVFCSFFFTLPSTCEFYTLSLHDALPIFMHHPERVGPLRDEVVRIAIKTSVHHVREAADRKSTRLNSSHANISYAVFCLKKKIIPDSANEQFEDNESR